MKILGNIEKTFGDGEGYSGGSIVMLTEDEARMLVMLQSACRYPMINANLSGAFSAILCFVEAKFAINEFQTAIDRLKEILATREN